MKIFREVIATNVNQDLPTRTVKQVIALLFIDLTLSFKFIFSVRILIFKTMSLDYHETGLTLPSVRISSMLFTPQCRYFLSFREGTSIKTLHVPNLIPTVLCKRNANEICRNKRNYAKFGNQIALRTFASDEKAAKFRCFYCSNVGEISQAR